MREKLQRIILTAAGVAALTGGTIAVTGVASAKPKHKHAKKHKATKKRDANAAKPAELTGDTKSSAESAALAAVPGGTVDRSFAAKAGNPDDAAYVVRVEKADDTYVDVLEDASFNVLKVVDARPCHGGHGHGGPGGPRPEDLTGDTKAQAEAAALNAVPGGEVKASHKAREGNPDNAAYAVDVEKSDDTYVVVLEDSSFNVLKVMDRPDRPEHGGGPHGDHAPDGDDS
jgi:hypothetical protein